MYDQLTQAEQDAIRERAKEKCLETNTPHYARYKIKSGEVFASSAYQREDGYYFEYKLNTEVKKKIDVRVWKQDADEMYFYVTDTVLSSDSYFLRIKKTENEDMISDILSDHCSDPKVYTASTSGTGPVSVTYEYEKSNAPNTDEFKDVYSFRFAELAFFGSYRITRTLRTVNSEDAEVSKSTYTSTLVYKAYDFTSDNYSDTSKYTQKFCHVKEDDTAAKYRVSQKTEFIGFELECVLTTKPADWDLSI